MRDQRQTKAFRKTYLRSQRILLHALVWRCGQIVEPAFAPLHYVWVGRQRVQVHGGAGYMSEYAVERFYRDVRLFRIYEGTTQIQQLVIARNMVREAS